jgi:hypothetical protein
MLVQTTSLIGTYSYKVKATRNSVDYFSNIFNVYIRNSCGGAIATALS